MGIILEFKGRGVTSRREGNGKPGEVIQFGKRGRVADLEWTAFDFETGRVLRHSMDAELVKSGWIKVWVKPVNDGFRLIWLEQHGRDSWLASIPADSWPGVSRELRELSESDFYYTVKRGR